MAYLQNLAEFCKRQPSPKLTILTLGPIVLQDTDINTISQVQPWQHNTFMLNLLVALIGRFVMNQRATFLKIGGVL